MVRRSRLRRLLAGAACAATLALTALAGTASAASTPAQARTTPTASANSTAGGHRHSVYLVVSSVPFPGTPTGTSGSASSRLSPDNVSRAGCSSGSKASWVRLFLDSGGTICYGFTGILNGINDGPAYEICSGNNTGYINSFVPYYNGIKTITFKPANGSTAEYYWYVDEFGDRVDFYVRTVSISGYSGSAAC